MTAALDTVDQVRDRPAIEAFTRGRAGAPLGPRVELAWEEPALARFLRRLASFSRLIAFDKRGTGLSDRVADDQLPTLEERMDDPRAVMDAVGSERATLSGFSGGGNLSALFTVELLPQASPPPPASASP